MAVGSTLAFSAAVAVGSTLAVQRDLARNCDSWNQEAENAGLLQHTRAMIKNT